MKPSPRVGQVVARQVGKVYGRQRVLADVNLRFVAGELVVVCGGNGAGKSTLLGVLSTRISPTSGEVLFDGRSADSDIRRALGVVSHQSLCYGDLSGRENLRFFARLYDIEEPDRRAEELLARVGLSIDPRPVRTYSRGMTQRLSVARALVHRPTVLLCDEPFSGLDTGGVERLCAVYAEERALGASIICVTHDFAPVAALCDRLVVLDRGRVRFDAAPPSRTVAALVDAYRGAAPAVAPAA